MRKRIYTTLLAAVAAFCLSAGSVSAFASESGTEPAAQALTEADQTSAAGNETEAELSGQKPSLAPESVTGDTALEAQYPTIEAQVEQQLSTLSRLSENDLEGMINAYNRQINLSVRNISNSMKDSSTLTSDDDSTMAMVKMLRNWYANRDSCGEFLGVKSYTADMTDQILTLDLDVDYSLAEQNDSQIRVTFTYDLARNVTLLNWEVKDSFSAQVGKAGMNTLIGLGTVFVVLLFLTFIISQIHWIPDLLAGKKKKEEAPVSSPAPAPDPAPAVEETLAEETDDLELIAVISAAIAASEQAPADGFVVRSIRRRGRKSNWRS